MNARRHVGSGKRPMIAPLLQIPINQLFIARPMIPFWPQLDRSCEERKGVIVDTTVPYVKQLEGESVESGEIIQNSQFDNRMIFSNSMSNKKYEKIKAAFNKNQQRIAQEIPKWKPFDDPDSNPYKTLLVARLSYQTNEKKLQSELERFGPIKNVAIVKNKNTGKHRGYAFVEYERERDMKIAYKEGNGMKIDGRRILIDVERGRTVKGWLPRRLGGGLGSSRK